MKFTHLSGIILGSCLGTAYASEQASMQEIAAKTQQLIAALQTETEALKEEQIKANAQQEKLTDDERTWALQSSSHRISAFRAIEQLILENRQLMQENERLKKILAS